MQNDGAADVASIIYDDHEGLGPTVYPGKAVTE